MGERLGESESPNFRRQCLTYHCEAVSNPEPLPVAGALGNVHVLAMDGQHVRLRLAHHAPDDDMMRYVTNQQNRERGGETFHFHYLQHLVRDQTHHKYVD